MSVVTLKVPVEVKEKMRKLRDRVNWSRELREYIIKRIREIEAEEALKEATRMIEKTRGVPEGFSAESVREDRDSH
ncbi:MAG: CopG family transcriptional regulator [Thermoproteota archaeon]|nr:MAG: CopG family transcriptional regulator [Candidatus Korarchaeota archaeon]